MTHEQVIGAFAFVGYGACFMVGVWFISFIWGGLWDAFKVVNCVKELRELVQKYSNDIYHFRQRDDEVRDYVKEFMRTHPLPEKKK